MKTILFIFALVFHCAICAEAAEDGAIVDGPNYAFTIAAPKGWKLTSTKLFQAAFYPADTSFEKSAVIMYARAGDKKGLAVASAQEMNRLDLKGIQVHHPAAVSKRIGTMKTALGTEIPLYSFSGGGYSELVAYAEEEKTIVVFVLSAEKPEQVKKSRAAFDELVASYVSLAVKPHGSNKRAMRKGR